MLAAVVECAGIAGLACECLNRPPQRQQRGWLKGRAGGAGGFPTRSGRLEEIQHPVVFGGSELGAGRVVAIGLVDSQQVGDFDHAFFHALKFVASS